LLKRWAWTSRTICSSTRSTIEPDASLTQAGVFHGLQAQAHGQVHSLHVLGHGPDRDVVHPGFGNRPQGAFIDPATGFQLGLAGIQAHRLAHIVQAQFVEHDDVGSRRQGLFQLPKAFHFHFHRLARGDLVGGADRLGDAPAGSDMVFLDQEGVIQPDAVVVAAATGDRVLLRQAQARQRLAGIQQLDLGIGDKVGQIASAGGHPGQQLQEVQRAAFASEQRTGRSFEVKQRLVGQHSLAVSHLPVHGDPWIQLAEHRVHPGGAGDDRGFAGNDGGLGQTFGRDQLRGDVAAADVFQQRAAHVGFDFGGQVGEA